MNITTSHIGSVVVLRLNEPRLTYPMLSDFASTATNLIGGGEKRLVLDISNPTDEERLGSEDFRKQLADAIANAIRAYREGR